MLCVFQKNKYEHNKSELQEIVCFDIYIIQNCAHPTHTDIYVDSFNQDRHNIIINRPYFMLRIRKLTSRIFRRSEIYPFKRRFFF